MKLDYSKMVDAGIDEDAIKRLVDYRKKIKKPLTQRSLEMSLREAYKAAKKHDLEPAQIIDYTIYRGWMAVKAEYIDPAQVAELYSAELLDVEYAPNYDDRGFIICAPDKPVREMTRFEKLSRAWAGLPGYTGDGLFEDGSMKEVSVPAIEKTI